MRKTFIVKCVAAGISVSLLTGAMAWSLSGDSVKASEAAKVSASAAPTAASGSQDNNQPPAMPPDSSGQPQGGPGGNGGNGGSESGSLTLSAANTADGTTKSATGSLSSESADENVVLAKNSGVYHIANAVLTKSGDSSSSDNSNFYALNAIVAAQTDSTVTVKDSKLTSSSEGSNALFATGSGAKIYADNVTISTTGNSSRGLDATYEGSVIASDMHITTTGDHCASLATDRGGGNISVDTATLSTAGQGSPLIYSTGVIEVNHVTGESTGSQIVGMEGLNTVRIKNSTLTGSAKKASEPIANGVILYQSTSGDSSTGEADFEASDSTLKSYVNGGAMFYVTNTDANVVLKNTTLDFDSDNNTLLTVAGNDGSNGWGSAGSNGGAVTFTGIGQTLKGDISCDGISSVNAYLTEKTSYTGTIINDTTYTGDGGVTMNLDGNSTWVVTKDCTLKALNAASGAKITDASGKTVTIKTTDGSTKVEGDSDITITTASYSTNDTSSKAGTISAFSIDRSGFSNAFTASSTDSSSDSTTTTDSSASNASSGSQASSASNASADTAASSSSSSSDKVTVKATKIVKAKATKKSITIKWKKIANAKGYVIYRSTGKKGTYKKIATIRSAKKVTFTNTKLKSGKKYYYKVQTYTKSGTKTVYASKSAAKTVKTKK